VRPNSFGVSHEAPNHKHQGPNKHQYLTFPNDQNHAARFRTFGLGALNLFGHWFLVLGHFATELADLPPRTFRPQIDTRWVDTF
jgi:hypothetical protein